MTVRIEPQTPSHADGLFAALRDPVIYAHLDDGPPKNVAAVRKRIESLQAGAPEGDGETWFNWTVFSEDVIAGYTQATVLDDGSACLAYVLSPVFWGQGVAFEGSRIMMAELVAKRGVVRFEADTEVGNSRSQRLLERLGFREIRREGNDVFFERKDQAKIIG